MNNKNIAVFYHVYCAEGWEKLFKTQLAVLMDFGLVENAYIIHIVIVGRDYDFALARTIAPDGSKFRLIHEKNNYEYSTLKHLYKYSEINDGFVLYMHTKGVSCLPVHKENSAAWRRFMEYFTIEKWEECIEILKNNYDCCGCNWHESETNEFPPHFSGNFWWATTDYIKTLPRPLAPPDFAFNSFDRRYYEFWIGFARPNVYKLCNNPKAFYSTKIEDHEYRL